MIGDQISPENGPPRDHSWGLLQGLVDQCAAEGLTINLRTEPDGMIRFGDWRDAVFGGRAATYVPFEKRMYLNPIGLAQYGSYRGDIHELAHAVWSLLLTSWERWDTNGYWGLWRAAQDAGRLLNEYSGERVEEGWAEDFTAFWTPCRDDGLPGERICRDLLRAADAARYAFLERVMTRLNAPVDALG